MKNRQQIVVQNLSKGVYYASLNDGMLAGNKILIEAKTMSKKELDRKQAIKRLGKYAAFTALGTFMLFQRKHNRNHHHHRAIYD